MDKMKFMELLYKKYLDLLKFDSTFKCNTYVYHGDVVVVVGNRHDSVFSYIKPFSDSEDDLKEKYKKLSDYETQLFLEKIRGEAKQDG